MIIGVKDDTFAILPWYEMPSWPGVLAEDKDSQAVRASATRRLKSYINAVVNVLVLRYDEQMLKE